MGSVTASRFFEDFSLNQVIPHRVGRRIGSGDWGFYIALANLGYADVQLVCLKYPAEVVLDLIYWLLLPSSGVSE